MPLFSFLPISPPGEGEKITQELAKNTPNTIPWALIIVGVAILIYSLFSKTKRKLIYLFISIALIVIGILLFIV